MFEALATDSFMKVVKQLPSIVNSMGSNSIIEYTKSTRIEPIVLVDANLQGQDYMSDIMVTLTNIFAAYYLQAAAISNTIGSVKVMQRLEKFQPKRSLMSAVTNRIGSLATEDFKLKLPVYGQSVTPYHHASLEAKHPAPTKITGAPRESVDALRNIDNLAVGKTMNVELIEGDKTVSIPVNIRLTPAGINSDVFVGTFAGNGFNNTAKERLWRFKTGELSGVSDMMLTNDLIKEHKRRLMADKTGIYKETAQRRRKNKLAAAISGVASLGDLSNIAIINQNTAFALEQAMGAKLSSFSARERMFDESSLMIMLVVDTEWETVKIYYQSVERPSELGIRDLKTVNKNTGPDVLEMIRAFTASSKTGVGPIL